jgi:class 3 adenylate cyclase
MSEKVYYYRWEWEFKSSPAQLWPLAANTNRFDYDTGLPPYEEDKTAETELANGRHRIQTRMYGIPLEWDEEPFQWAAPYRFGVVRNYKPGPLQPIAQLRVLAQFQPKAEGGTHLVYEVWATPANFLGHVAIPLQIGLLARRDFGRVFRRYDEMAQAGRSDVDEPGRDIHFADGGRARLQAARQTLAAQGVDAALVERLTTIIETADNMSLDRIRPYALADHWGADRREVLALCLLATRAGLLDFQWDLLCPSCRDARESVTSLGDVGQTVHCHTCQIDYTANFSQSVELTFRPNPAIRIVPEHQEYCMSGPRSAPHIAVQQLLPPGAEREVRPGLENGRYRLRTMGLPGKQLLQIEKNGEGYGRFPAQVDGWPDEACRLHTEPTLLLENLTDEEQLFILERLAWADDAVVASEVTVMQRFRDLFAEEALRPGDQIVVGSLTILFTDLVGSTQMYRDIGDAPAFGLVMDHFDVLQTEIAAADGAVVKTIGDAVMAVFRDPAAALRVVLAAQAALAHPSEGERPLRLKAALHYGPCIGVNLNGKFDYFGSTVNVASRLEKLATGEDVIISEAVYADPEVARFLQNEEDTLAATPFRSELRGFDEEYFMLWRVKKKEE